MSELAPEGDPAGDEENPAAGAVRQAGVGTSAWRAVVHVQQYATPDHSDFYALAGELVDTLAAVTSLARVLARQVEGYADALPAGAVVYDDTRRVGPRVRLADAVLDLDELIEAVELATSKANGFWAGIGHIGVEEPRDDTDFEGIEGQL